MIISLDKFKNSGSNSGSGNGGSGKYVVTDGTRFALSTWETIPEELDFSQVTDFSGKFIQATNLKTGLYLDDWSKAVDCSTMYQMCSNLESVPDMNTSNCIGFMKTFQGTSIVNAPNIDVSNAIRVDFMFDSCPNLTRIGVLDTAHLTNPATFKQLCTFCPNLTTIEGIDFSGLTAAPILFHQNDSLTNITVNGSISFSWLQYGFGELPNLSEDSVISILSAMARCNNPEETKQMNILYNYDYGTDISAINAVMEECRSKGWFIGGIQMKVPYVIIDSVSSEVEPGGTVEVAYSVTNDFDHFIALDKITLHIYDDYGYEKDFNIESASDTIFLSDSDLKDPFFRTYVVYGGQQYSGSEYSYTRLEQTEPEEPEGGETKFSFWVKTEEVNPGDTVCINYEITNYDNLGFAPIMLIVNNDGADYIEPITIKDSMGYVDITDNPDYEPQCTIALCNPDSGEPIYETTLYWKRLDGSSGGSSGSDSVFNSEVDTAAFGDPTNAIPVSFTEFAAAEPSNEQWYELTGVIRRCPRVEDGILILDDPTGEYTVDEPHVNLWPLEGSSGIFINGITTELIGGMDMSFEVVFPGDGSTITIRTLRHTTDADYDAHGLGTVPEGSIIGGKFNSPCAILIEGGKIPEEPTVNIEDGEYVIVSSDNYLLSAEVNNNRLNAVQGYTFVNPDTSLAFDPLMNPDTSIITDDKLKWTISKDGNMYYIYNLNTGDKMYLAWDGGNYAHTQATNYGLYINADIDNEGRYKISIIDNEEGRFLQKNSNNPFFAFYKEGQKGSVYLIKIS